MNCEQCGKEIKLKLKLEEILVDTLTIKATDADVEKFRQEFLKSIQKDLTLIISEKKEELLNVCSSACFHKLLYNEYLNRLEKNEIGHEFYEEKLKYTKELIENYNQKVEHSE